jgi:zinc transport system substrate-binding protein
LIFLYTLHFTLYTATTKRRSATNMKTKLIFSILVTFCIALQQPSQVRADRLLVVASVFPLFDFAREVAGPAADVRLLLPPGVDPHSWEPKPSDIVELSRADIFLYISDGMEPWAGSIARAVGDRGLMLVKILESLDRAEQRREDPHFWLDLSLASGAVERIGELLAKRDPEKEGHYRGRAAAYAGELSDLDAAFENGLRDCASRQLVTGGHAAFGYLARRYNLDQVSVYGLSPDAEPSPRHLAEIVNVIDENNIKTIFSEELMNPRMTQVLSEETGVKIMVLNPGGNLSADQWDQGVTFLEIMKQNLDSLMGGLDCE